jgi:hypothetical protein
MTEPAPPAVPDGPADPQAPADSQVPEPSVVPGLRWEARVLAPWMPEGDARLVLAAAETDRELTPGQEEWLAAARERVRSRPAGVDQDGLVRPLPPEMDAYTARMGEHPESQWYLSQGYTPALVDLSRICSFQSKIYTEHSGNHAADIDVEDMRAVAEVTMPLGTPPVVAPKFDPDQQAFVTDLANHNLRVVGAFGGPDEAAPQPGTYSMGFHVRVIASFVQVVSVQGRWFVRDGYHRCAGLLRRGATFAPALVKQDTRLGAISLTGMLPYETIMGDRPPLLPDFLDDDVACTVWLTAARRVVVVQASEVSISG